MSVTHDADSGLLFSTTTSSSVLMILVTEAVLAS
jgi:hypothetical protein